MLRAWLGAHWKAVLIGLAGLALLAWSAFAAYGAAVRWQTKQDAKIAAVVAINDSARARIRALVADSAAQAKRLAALAHEAATARAAQAAAQHATLVLRRHLGNPQTARDTSYQTVIDSLDRALQYAAVAARADTMRIVALTHDRDGWRNAALHADSALKNSTGALKPERCFFGIVKCPSRTAVALIGAGFGALATAVVVVAASH